MPKVTMIGVQSTGGDWTPLPSADYTIQIDSVESGTSKGAGAPQLRVIGHVVDGPFAEKKCNIFYSLKENSVWKTKALLEAAGVEYEQADSDRVDTETGKPMEQITFDSDDLIGCAVRYSVSQRDYQGKMQNDYNKERAPEGATPRAAAKPAAAAAPTAPAPAPAPARQRRTSHGAA